MGRDTFIQDWAWRFPGWHLDLDHALADTGVGRVYGAPLDAPLILETIDHAIAQTSYQGTPASSPPGVFLLGPADDVIARLVTGEAPGQERIALKEWLVKLDLDDALRRLTLALEPDPERNDRYGFLLYILPLELNRRIEREGPTLANLIIDEAIEFLRLMRHSD